MRHVIRLALIASFLAGLGCNLPAGPSGTGSSSGSSGNGSGNSQGTMSATIANIPWTANGRVTATYSPAQNGVGSSVLNLTGVDLPLTQTFGFAISSVLAGSALTPGTYQVGTPGTNATLTDGIGTTYQATGSVGSGTVTLVTFSTTNRTATGSFSFIVVQTGGIATRAVANGSFSVTF
jgi:hypothetical protein